MPSSKDAVATISFFRFSGFQNKWWAFKQMRLALPELQKLEGANFCKLMGTGGGSGYSLRPNFSVYALLICWESRNHYENFKESNQLYRKFLEHSSEEFTSIIKAFRSKGFWDAVDPFHKHCGNHYSPLIGVLTRASIKVSKLAFFWKLVPRVSQKVSKQEGVYFSIGCGEWPLVELVTFSIWSSKKAMENFAYSGKEHAEAVKKSRQLRWFKEELFARFEIVETMGTWNQKEILPSAIRFPA